MKNNNHNNTEQSEANKSHSGTNISRRSFLKRVGGGAVATGAVLTGTGTLLNACNNNGGGASGANQEPPKGQMTMRTLSSGQKTSLLGYGMMRLPTTSGDAARDSDAPIDQRQVNRLVDYAIEHGLCFFDTSPAYCKGESEKATGIALKRHKRSEFLVSTKLSNFNKETWTFKASREMFENSLRDLQVDHLDVYLLHGIGMPDENGDAMAAFNGRFIDNGMLPWLIEQRAKGRIRNLGFSYHGDINVFNQLLQWHDEGKYHFDIALIELNYLDWHYANEMNPRNTDAEYLYTEVHKRGIPAMIMEPLLGGRLSNVPQSVATELKKKDPAHSVASWAFRYAGTREGVAVVLSGMTYMEHLKDNLLSYCPLHPLTEEEMRYLDTDIAGQIEGNGTIPCTGCKYCMPCPYGVNIPAVFDHYNKCNNEGSASLKRNDPNYSKLRREFLIGYDRSVPRLRQANHCIGCGQCMPHCPQGILIPQQMQRIDKYVEQLKQHKF